MTALTMATEVDARRRQERIRTVAATVVQSIDKIGALVAEAKESNDHLALGYPSWTAYLADTFADEPMRLERDERRKVVALLHGEGMATRTIAPIVGASVGTVHGDQVFNSEHLPETATDADSPNTSTGRDGKQYPRSVPSKPRRRPITDAASDAGWELRRSVERLQRLIDDDRYSQNKNEVATHLRGHLMNAVEVCQDLLDRMNPEGN